MTLPSTKAITYTYAGTGDCDNHASRVTSVKDGSLRLSSYEYRDLATVTTTTHNELPMYSTEAGTTAGTYTNLDTFGRITSSRWVKDLSTDVDVYRVDLSYDRNSNITWAEDKIASGFDVKYDIDSLNRLTKADEGTRSGGSVTSRKRQQEWTLSHTGNWNNAKLDLDGDLVYTGVREYNDTRVHNKANEITTQDTDSNNSVNYTLTHDAVGNMTDDGNQYTYKYDPFGRLIEIRNRSTSNLVAEYKYNGLGFRIGYHSDVDVDGDVDSNDPWYYLAYDEAWRLLSVYRSSDTSPKEEFVPHNAGLDGLGGSSMLDGVICRYKDANTAWTAASDGTLEERVYLLQNWRGDVSLLVDSGSNLRERVKYFSYGIPFAMPAADVDCDGDCDAVDTSTMLTWINTSVYNVLGDLDLDGDVDATDRTTAINTYRGTTLGFGVLSNVGNRKGYAGYEKDANLANKWHVRNRVLDSELGRWTRRDPLGYVDGVGVYAYVRGNPTRSFDSRGLKSTGVEGTCELNPKGGCSWVGACCCPKSLTLEWDDFDPNDPPIGFVGSGGVRTVYGELTTSIVVDWIVSFISAPCALEWWELSNKKTPGNPNPGEWTDIANVNPVPDPDLQKTLNELATPGSLNPQTIVNKDNPGGPMDFADYTLIIYFAIKISGDPMCGCEPNEITAFATFVLTKSGTDFSTFKSKNLPSWRPHFNVSPPAGF